MADIADTNLLFLPPLFCSVSAVVRTKPCAMATKPLFVDLVQIFMQVILPRVNSFIRFKMNETKAAPKMIVIVTQPCNYTD